MLLFSVSCINASDETLYSCFFDGKYTTYHKNDALRMELLGAKCRLMSEPEHITCSMDGVKLDYSREEANRLLREYPDAICESGSRLYMSGSVSEPGENNPSGGSSMIMQEKVTVFFPVDSNHLSRLSKTKIRDLVKRYPMKGYMYTITGFTSATGSNAHNHLLSLKRAGIVRNELIKNGVGTNDILSVDALGEESLRHNTKREVRQNRAVEIKVYH